jgi:hypothetical protein
MRGKMAGRVAGATPMGTTALVAFSVISCHIGKRARAYTRDIRIPMFIIALAHAEGHLFQLV